MDKEYLIHDKPLKALFVFSLPMIIGNIFQQFYTMVDSMVVGRYVSENALAAVGACYSLTNVFICIAMGGGVGASVLASRYFGARNYRKMKRSAYTALLAFLGIAVLLGAFGLLTGRKIMQLLRTPASILDMATVYLNIYFIGLPFLFIYNVLSAMFNAIGRSRTPLYLLIFSSVLNIFLDVYMVTSLHMGVAGVAWATLIAQGISAVVSLFLFLRTLSRYTDESTGDDAPKETGKSAGNRTKEGKKPKPKVFSWEELKDMSRIALPSILQQSTVSIGMMLVQSVVNSFGPKMLAGFSAAMRIESICVVPMTAIGNAISSYAAQNIGANRLDRVQKGYRAANLLVAAFAVVICVVLESSYTGITSSFLGSDGTQVALRTGSNYLKFMGWFFTIIGLKMVTDGVLRGAGDMKMFTIANFVNLAIRVTFAVTMAPRFGIAMIWTAVPIGWLVNFIISFSEYRTGKWQTIAEGSSR
jgi:putative MATE family efflux protein